LNYLMLKWIAHNLTVGLKLSFVFALHRGSLAVTLCHTGTRLPNIFLFICAIIQTKTSHSNNITYMLPVLSCLLCNCCWLTVRIVAVVLCVLLSYVYLLSYVGIAVSYFRYRTAGYNSVFGRSCYQPPRHRFFLVSLCL
jgi:hypothetical protein